eukprot:1158208-Pelagomonas_calceolata.AAC.15
MFDHVPILVRAQQISESTTIAEKEKQKVVVIVDSVTKKAAEIAAVKDDAERDLSQAKPALDAALSALNSISPKDITSLKALKNPPDVVKRIFDCVLLLRHWWVDKAQWQDIKGTMVLVGTYDMAVKMMSDMSFLSALMNFPKEQINDETVRACWQDWLKQDLVNRTTTATECNTKSARIFCKQCNPTKNRATVTQCEAC